MTMSMSEQPTSAFEAEADHVVARNAGWRRVDLEWERLQEQGNTLLGSGNLVGATRCFRRAGWIAFWRFEKDDPRRVATLANLALADRIDGHEGRARRRYAKARRLWAERDPWIEGMTVARRARSSLFHLRMEARHWETYRDNTCARMRAFGAETAEALAALERSEAPPHRLFDRWRGEKPSVFDDTRRFLAAALMVGHRDESGTGSREQA